MGRATSSSNKLKLVFLVGELGVGGSERQLFLLLKYLDKTRYDASVIVFNPSPNLVYNDILSELGVRVVQVPNACRSIPQRIKFLYGMLRKISPHVVHSWTVHDNPYAGVVGLLSRVPIRWGSLRGSLSSSGWRALPWLYQWLSLRSISRLVVNSRAVVEDLIANGYPRERIILLPNCVEISHIDSATLRNDFDLSMFGIDDSTRIVGIVGNLRAVKNQLMFVDAIAQVVKRHPDVQALIVGQPVAVEPDMPDKLIARIREHNLQSRLFLMGFCADVPALLRRFSVFCLTSNSEGTPNAILEAMSVGCPVVATRVGGVPELITHGENGLLVEAGDTSGLGRAIDQLLTKPDLAVRLGEAGRTTIQLKYKCHQKVQRLTRLYDVALTRWLR